MTEEATPAGHTSNPPVPFTEDQWNTITADSDRRRLYASLDPPERDTQREQTPTGGPVFTAGELSTIFRHSHWKADRRRVWEALIDTQQTTSRLHSFRDCGSFATVMRNDNDPNRYRIAGSACRDRFCNPCARERSQNIKTNILEHVQDKPLRFITLTLRSTNEPLVELLDKLHNSFAALRRRGLWKRKVGGGVAMLEVKWSEATQRWHPHFHVLFTGQYIPQDRLRDAWREITKTSYIVDVRLVRSKDQAAKYITKYATKPLDGSFTRRPDLLREAMTALKGRKLALTFGTWRGVVLADTASEEGWSYVARLGDLICDAANGDVEANQILVTLSDQNLSLIYERAPPPTEPILTNNATEPTPQQRFAWI